MGKTKILVVGDPGSIHTARFVNLLQDLGYSVRIFQSEYTSYQDEHLHNTVIYVYFPSVSSINNNRLKFYCPIELDDKFVTGHKNIATGLQIYKEINRNNNRQTRVKDLIKVLKGWKPEIVFSLKMQNDGYTVLKAKKTLKNRFTSRWVHFCWGTDIEFFGKDKKYRAEHLPKIKELLQECDFFVADSKRDVKQVSKYNFKGINLGQLIANGGFNLSEISEIRKKHRQKRNIILVKGRVGGYVGKAYNIISALQKIPEVIKDYKVKIILATPEIENVTDYLKQSAGFDCEILPKMPYRKLLEIFAQSKIAISATTVDGSPSFLLEAMLMGVFPIHSDMDSIREWIIDGKNGLLFPVEDTDALADCIKKALTNDKLINSARAINWVIARQKLDRAKIKKQVKNIVEKTVLNH